MEVRIETLFGELDNFVEGALSDVAEEALEIGFGVKLPMKTLVHVMRLVDSPFVLELQIPVTNDQGEMHIVSYAHKIFC